MIRTWTLQLRHLGAAEHTLLRTMCWHSARMYNVALYSVRQHFFEHNEFLGLFKNYHACKENENFQILPSQVAHYTMRIVDRSFRSFFQLKKKSGYEKPVRIPRYLPKDGFFGLHYESQAFHVRDGFLELNIGMHFMRETGMKSLCVKFPIENADDKTKTAYLKDVGLAKFKELRVLPQFNAESFNLAVVFETADSPTKLNSDNCLSIDLGLNNLATCWNAQTGESFILDGKEIKAINNAWNKRQARLNAAKMRQGIKCDTRRQFRERRNRENRIRDIMRKSAAHIRDYCLANDIGTIIVGKNDGWKNGIEIGKRNNQKFVNVPHNYLLSCIRSKCEQCGIEYVEVNEAHTSKCSALDNEPVEHQEYYAGSRPKRGQFKTKGGIKINADVNGAINMWRKVSAMDLGPKRVKATVSWPVRIKVFQKGRPNTAPNP